MRDSHRRLTVLLGGGRTIVAVSAIGESPRVVIADDHPCYRAGLARLLREHGIEVVAEVPNGAAALQAAVQTAPDVVVMDLNMPGLAGLEATRVLLERAPGCRVLVLTVSAQEPDVTDAILAGACGYVLKDDLPADIVAAVHAAAAGSWLVSPRVAKLLLEHAAGSACLGRHELGVLQLLAAGRAEQEISETLVTSSRSVREHLVSILLKLAVDERPRPGLRLVPQPSRAP
jgi:DNA-binding NarL/FixJ family response regulator